VSLVVCVSNTEGFSSNFDPALGHRNNGFARKALPPMVRFEYRIFPCTVFVPLFYSFGLNERV
jgi:hypothetical protein